MAPPHAEAPSEPEPTRIRLYDHIRRNPAAHILEMAQRFELAHPTVMYHLGVLEDEGYVESLLWGKRRVHFDVQGRFSPWEREVLAILALDEPLAVLRRVSARPGTYPRELARDIGLSESTVKRYVPELLRMHALVEEEGGFRRRLYVSPGFRRRARTLLTKLAPDARPVPILEALLHDGV